MKSDRSKTNGSKAKKKNSEKDATPHFVGWLTSDEDEIERRRHRGLNAQAVIQILE